MYCHRKMLEGKHLEDARRARGQVNQENMGNRTEDLTQGRE